MQNVQDLQDKIFFEAKNILDTLAKINTKEELLNKQDLFSEVTERIAFLKLLEKNKESFINEIQPQIIENQEVNAKSEAVQHFEDHPFEEDIIEEEVMFTNELNDIEYEEFQEVLAETEKAEEPLEETIEEPVFEPSREVEPVAETESVIEALKEAFVEEEILVEPVTQVEAVEEPVAEFEQKEIPMVIKNEDPHYAEKIAEKERLFQEQEERRRKIVEFNKEHETKPVDETPVFENKTEEQHHHDKKFKLANIKGLKTSVQNLFDDDPLEKLEEEQKVEPKVDSGSLLKTNIPTDFMEAEKMKPEFKLDLNDRVAFTKVLFKGDENELKHTIDKLNSFKDIEDARKYLSDIYYEKEWNKADEYAQRLWSLVENKFM